jgi:trehalose 6-phosphate synthase/phosphatase
MQSYVKRCPNSFIEEKEFSIVWHFRNAEAQQAKMRAIDLYGELRHISHTFNVHVLTGNKIIEVHTKGINKVYILRKLLKENNYDFILACGDDNTDEDMFKVLAKDENAYTIKIGDEASYAKYNLYTPQMTLSLLSFFQNYYSVR